MRISILVSIFCVLAVVSAKKHVEENVDLEPESGVHSAKKYSKDQQKAHHHVHKHKKHTIEEQEESLPKQAPVEVPESEIKLQEDLATNKKAVNEDLHKQQNEDLHLQDLAYEENLKKEQKKKAHHGNHHAKAAEKKHKKEQKLFADQDANLQVDKEVIEDSFEPLEKTVSENEKASKDKKHKDKPKHKKAYEKGKEKNKKNKDGKKNKDKKHKKDKKKY